jgi:hypothetical protein
LVDDGIPEALMNCGHFIHAECLIRYCKGLRHGKRPTCQKEGCGAEIDSIQIESVFRRSGQGAEYIKLAEKWLYTLLGMCNDGCMIVLILKLRLGYRSDQVCTHLALIHRHPVLIHWLVRQASSPAVAAARASI